MSEAVKLELLMQAGDTTPALERLRNNSVGLVILDIKMPGKSWIELPISLER